MNTVNTEKEMVMGIVRAVAPKFFSEGHNRVYVAQCCKRIMIAPTLVDRCRTCGKIPIGFWTTPTDI